MKFSYLFKSMLVLSMVSATLIVKAQNNDELLHLLIQKKVVSHQEADSLQAVLAIKEQQKRDNQTAFPLSLGRALNLTGLFQERYQSFQGTSGTDEFDIRRARLDFKGAITDHWDYELYIELPVRLPYWMAIPLTNLPII